jgi:hypothetical protein
MEWHVPKSSTTVYWGEVSEHRVGALENTPNPDVYVLVEIKRFPTGIWVEVSIVTSATVDYAPCCAISSWYQWHSYALYSRSAN